MDVSRVEPQQYVDIFSTPGTEGNNKPQGAHFGAFSESNVDILTTPENKDTNTDKPEGDKSETPSSTTDTSTAAPNPGEVDLLGLSGDKAPVVKTDTKIPDLSTYFQDRIKSGKFVEIQEEGEDGQQKTFIPQTLEDFDEVIDIQVNHQLEKRRKEVEEGWYQSKSPAWQAVAKYAEMATDPSEIVPFIQGVRTIDSVSELDPADLGAAEKIVRVRLEQRGDSEEIIQEQLEALKSTDKLTSTAQKYKPLILNQEKQHLAKLVQEKKDHERQYQDMITGIRTNAVKAIEAPIFGKSNLKQEEKAAIFELIGMPSQETRGYPIFSAIDELFEKGDFDTLKQIALLVSNKEAFINYVATNAANATSESLQRKLRIATDSRTSSSNNGNEGSGDNRTVQRNRYNQTPKFGRQ